MKSFIILQEVAIITLIATISFAISSCVIV